MKMKNYRLFLLGFVSASFVLLTGFEKPDVNNAPLTEKQSTSTEVKKVQFQNKESPVKPKQKKSKNKHSVSNAKNSSTEDTELQKSLDLSIPFNDSEKAWLKIEQNRIAQVESSNVFTTEKKKPRPVYLNSQMLMSQEPELDKQKSLDGAGIVINLKR